MLVTLQGFSQKCSYKEGTKIFPHLPIYSGSQLHRQYAKGTILSCPYKNCVEPN